MPPGVIASRLPEPRVRVERILDELHARIGVRDREGLVRAVEGR